MHRQMLMLAVVAAALSTAACEKKDVNAITGSTDYTSVELTSDPPSFSVPVNDSAEFTPTATVMPQNVAISNGLDNMTFTFADPEIAEINGSGYIQGDAVGSTTLQITYVDVNHNFESTSIDVPVTVTGAPPPRIVR